MYHLKKEKFGAFLKHTFYNEKTNAQFSIIPEFGACLLDVVFDGRSIIDGHQSAETLLQNEWHKSTFLFPFPNRLKDGKYHFQGKNYQFPINEPSKNNALHGFDTNQDFELISLNCLENSAEIHCRHNNAGNNPAYPFAFSFDVKMRIADSNSFSLEMMFKNESAQKIPVGLGWHPYFNCFGKINHASMKMPDCQIIGVDEFAIPTKERFEYHYFKEKRQIGNAVLDNAFELKNKKGRAEVTLFFETGTLNYWQEIGAEKFNFLQIFTPPHRQSIAIEPMTCNINAFNNGDGLIVLNPDEQFSTQLGFTFQAKAGD